jgi:hypothetical protein
MGEKFAMKNMVMTRKMIAHVSAGALIFAALQANAESKAGEKDSKALCQQRLQRNHEKLRAIVQADSEGWVGVTSLEEPDKKLEQIPKERLQRKVAALLELCSEQRFASLAEVDSLSEMSDEEQTFCKTRLKVLNPTMP